MYGQLQVQSQKRVCEAFLQLILHKPVPESILKVLRKSVLLTAMGLPKSVLV